MRKVAWVIVTVLGIATWMLNAMAQQSGDQQWGPPGGEGENHPIPPIETALDANSDGMIDAEEIANASNALAGLDKNGDGKLTGDEYRPPIPSR